MLQHKLIEIINNFMLIPKKVKHRKWQTGRVNAKKEISGRATRGTTVSFGAYGMKATSAARVKSIQLEAARKVISRTIGKTGKLWIRVFPDRPYTAKPAEVGMGKGKGDPQGYCVIVKPGHILFEVDGVTEVVAREALRKGSAKLPITTKVYARELA
jgi:large subunit ribosomal protein L16